tara:strand:- start:5470 stop:6891 length:1422 start_codon:yes stop_codon:yes gene_type:complete
MSKSKIKYTSIFIFLILLGSILRIYNVNFDDLWYDEMVSFWISNPEITFAETLKRIFSSNLMVSYEIILKIFHFILSYDVHISRYLSSLISIFSLILFYYLLKKNSSKQTAMLGLALLVINIYHIKYSFELRSYILTFLLAIILINFIFENKTIKQSFLKIDYFFISLISLLLLFSHAFSVIIIFSILLFLFIVGIKSERERIQSRNLALVLTASLIFFLVIYLNNINHYPDWIEQVKPSFYSNYYFSKFFGSRILGIIFFVTFISLLFYFRKEFLINFNIYTFLLILFLNSYFMPLIFGYFFKPILVDRYILFILIPIIALLSHFIILIKNKFVKIFLIVFLLVIQFFNLFDEYTFKQFYTNIYPSKPEVRKIIQDISSSDVKVYSFEMSQDNLINYNLIRSNYLKKYVDKLKYDLVFFDYINNNTLPKRFWFIYFKDITDKKFLKPNMLNNYTINDSKFYNLIEIHLFELN